VICRSIRVLDLKKAESRLKRAVTRFEKVSELMRYTSRYTLALLMMYFQ